MSNDLVELAVLAGTYGAVGGLLYWLTGSDTTTLIGTVVTYIVGACSIEALNPEWVELSEDEDDE